jgi:hypothetical protein
MNQLQHRTLLSPLAPNARRGSFGLSATHRPRIDRRNFLDALAPPPGTLPSDEGISRYGENSLINPRRAIWVLMIHRYEVEG